MSKKFDKRLLKILACPICRGDIKYNESKQELKCNKCSKKYKVKDGIPVMLPEMAIK